MYRDEEGEIELRYRYIGYSNSHAMTWHDESIPIGRRIVTLVHLTSHDFI